MGPGNRSTQHLPQFLRKAWVSTEARRLHENRIKHAAAAWATAEWRSADSVRPCALISVLSIDYSDWTARIEAAGQAMAALRVVKIAAEGATQELFTTETVVGSRRNVMAFRSAWIKNDNDAMGALLGYPTCCREFFHLAFVANKVSDPTWLIGHATPRVQAAQGKLSVSGFRETNILLRRLGVRAIPHFPCSFACEPSRRFSRNIADLASSRGQAQEIDWLYEMLDWPSRWSALHGVAEIRTPVLKIATHTDVTAQAQTLDWLGRTLPPEAAKGLDFPYCESTR